jgi:hypothetical protein
MFSTSKITPEQKEALSRWAAEGATMSDLQRRLKEEFDLSVTYMDTRFIVLDLGIELREETKETGKKVADADADADADTDADGAQPQAASGAVVVTMDAITLPGALVSGRVRFSDGETAVWMLDQTGRPGLDPDTPGYRPVQEDILEFQTQLRELIRKSGL